MVSGRGFEGEGLEGHTWEYDLANIPYEARLGPGFRIASIFLARRGDGSRFAGVSVLLIKVRLIVALASINLGVSVGTASFLPSTQGGFGYSGWLEYFLEVRQCWDIAWGVLAASVIASIGAFLIVDGVRR